MKKKGRFPEIDDAVFTFFHERHKTGLFVSYDLLREEAIKKARFWTFLKVILKPVKDGPLGSCAGWGWCCGVGWRYARSSRKILNKSCWIISSASPIRGRQEIFWWGKWPMPMKRSFILICRQTTRWRRKAWRRYFWKPLGAKSFT